MFFGGIEIATSDWTLKLGWSTWFDTWLQNAISGYQMIDDLYGMLEHKTEFSFDFWGWTYQTIIPEAWSSKLLFWHIVSK